MTEWLKSNVLVLVAVTILAIGWAYSHGQTIERLSEMKRTEERLEQKIDTINERLSRLEGRIVATGE